MLEPKRYLCAGCGARTVTHHQPDSCHECGAEGSMAPEAEVALKSALDLTGEEPGKRGGKIRARQIALEALFVLHPEMSLAELAQELKYPSATVARNALANARRAQWWGDVAVDHVIGSLVSHQYGARAA